jgi:hypothetical protein
VDKTGEDGGFADGLFSKEDNFDLGFYLGNRRLRLILLNLKYKLWIIGSELYI